MNTPELESDACYLALKAHDARFDGSFFTAVTSTGIYCRPVCRVKTPRRENCRFFRHAAQAEAAGFRPCLRCRPELAPRAASWSTQDASRILALQAARDIYTRRGEGLSIWVAPSSAITASDPAEKGMMFEPAESKIYRHPTFYDVPEEVGHM